MGVLSFTCVFARAEILVSISGSDVNSTPHCSTLPSRNKRILKSSLSKTSSLKKTYPHKFEPEENLQQIVKQKRENCLQVSSCLRQIIRYFV